MCKQVHVVERDTSLRDVARIMKEKDIGDVLVVERGGRLCGIVTDRDLVVRAVAAGRDLESTRAGDVCSDQLVTLEPSSMVDQAVGLMREHAVRRVPVIDKGIPVGIVSMGDLARALDPSSALADVSAAPPSA